jgi:hypothetical protein
MTAVSKIRELLSPRVRASGLLIRDLIHVPSVGVTPEHLASVEPALPRPLSESHRAILSVWNGIDLDVIRILGIPPVERGILPITKWQGFVPDGPEFSNAIAFACDPAGFLYVELPDGSVHSSDHDGGGAKRIASSIDEFIEDVIFGKRATEFAGDEWLQELRALGLV